MTTQLRLHRTHQWRILALLTLLAYLLATLPLRQIGLFVGLGAGAILLLRWPWLAWLGLAAALPFAGAAKVGPLSGADLLLGLAVALWFVDGVRRRQLAVNWYPPPALTLAYIAALLLSTLGAADLGEAAKEVVKWSEFALVLLLVPAMVRPVQVPWLAAALLVGGMSQAALGLHQFFNGIGPDWFIVLGGYMRASGSFLQPNPYAGYLGLCLPVALSLAIWSVGNLLRANSRCRIDVAPGAQAPWWDLVQSRTMAGQAALALFYLAATGLIVAGLLASWSRGGWLGALAGVGTVIIFRSRKMAAAVAIVALVLLAALLLGSMSSMTMPEPVTERLAGLPAYVGIGDVLNQPVTDENFSVVERVAHWAAALRMWEQAPWLGVGPGNYAAAYAAVRLPQWEEHLGHAHNIYLNVLGETGIVGFVAYMVLWIGIGAWTILRIRRSRTGSWMAALALGVLGVLVHLAVHNVFDNLYVQGIYLHVALWLACLGVGEVDT